jgi:hypothetical protein
MTSRGYRTLTVIGFSALAVVGGALLYRFRPAGHERLIESLLMLTFAAGMLLVAVAKLFGRR